MEERSYVVFEDENGKEIELDIIEEFEFGGKNYAILLDMSGVAQDDSEEESAQDLCIVELVKNGDDEEFLPIEDSELFEKVADFAYNLLQEKEDECGCGGDCDCNCCGDDK